MILAPRFLLRNGVASANGAGATLDVILTVAVARGQMLLVHCASGALGGSNGASSGHTLIGVTGFTKEAEVTRLDDTGGFRSGVTNSRWRLRATVPIPAGTVLTLTCSASNACRAIRCSVYDCFSLANDLVVMGLATDHGSTGGASDPAVHLEPPDWDDALWVGSGSFDGDDNLTVPVPGGWAADGPTVLNGGGNFTGLTAFGHSRVVEALEQTYTVAAGSDRRWSMIVAAYALQGPLEEPVEGGRQYQADFDTATDGNNGTTTAKRPDAVAVDYLTATGRGPSAEGVAGVPQTYAWKARALPGSVQLCRQNAGNTAWDPEVELFTYTGADIAEIFNGLAFDRDGHVALAAERPTGGAGAPEVWLYWWNPDTPGYEFVMVEAGRTPKLVLDDFPHLSALCAPTPDVQLIYLKEGAGLVRRESRDGYATLYGSPLPYVPNIWLEGYFPTLSRVLQVQYSRRNRRTGEVELRQLDSLPFPDSLLLLPRFYPGNSDDITFGQGEEFLGAPGQVDVEQLRVGVLEDVDAIEVEAETTDFGLTGWNEQAQMQDGAGAGFDAGDSVQFPFTITHGDGAMSPRAFRARTVKQVGPDTCYSPWLYWFAGHGFDALDIDLINHDDTAKVDTYTFTATRFWVTYIPPGGTYAVRQLCAGATTIALQQIFDPGIGGGWQAAYRVEVQGSDLIGFDSTDGRFDFTLLSKIFVTASSANPWLSLPELPGNQSPGPFPPNPSPT